MKRILILAVAAIAVCAANAKTKIPSKAEIEKRDKANWGGVDYSAAPDGENSVANDLAQMRSMARGEAATMKKLFDFCKTLPEGIQTALNIPAMTALGQKIFPFFDLGLGWVVPALIGLVIGLVLTVANRNKAGKAAA